MKKSTSTFLFSFFLFLANLTAQHTIVLDNSNTFTPDDLVINVGDTVTWDNQGGFHNVNGSQQSYPNNPESFENGLAANAPWVFSHTFNIPGEYDYHCDPHFGVEMIGKITVLGPSDVVITEIMYNDPTSGSDAYEFIELFNNTANPIEMEGWSIMDAINFTFPQHTLAPGGYVILATNSTNFEMGFGVPAFQFQSGALSNGGERITLRDENGDIVDLVMYGNAAAGWPSETGGQGASLVLCDVNSDNNTMNAWAAATTPTGFIVNGTEVLANPAADSDCPFGAIIGFNNTGFTIVEDAGNASVTINLTNGNADTTRVLLELETSSTAINGSDFQITLPMEIVFPGGMTTASRVVSIPILNDTDIEGVETLVLHLTNPTNNATINPDRDTFIYNIIDDDTPFTNALVITGVFDTQVEPSDTWAKGFELQALADIPDASIFGVSSADNGNGSTAVEDMLPNVSLQEGDCFYVANDSVRFFNFFGFYPNMTSFAAGINGNDPIVLYENLLPIDVFGDINTNGTGEPWEYKDGWAYRKSGTGPDGSFFQLSNWIFSGIDAFDDAVDNATAPVPFPDCDYSPIALTTPTTNNDVASTDINVAVTINVLANDDLPNPLTSMDVTSGPDNGMVTVNGLNDITYTPNADFCGTDGFTYRICDMNGCDSASVTINVICPTTYPIYDISTVTSIDADGIPDSMGVTCQLQGILYGINFQANSGWMQFALYDGTGGITVFDFDDFGLTFNEGDEFIVRGTIDEHNCVTQIQPDTLWKVSIGNPLVDPQVTTIINESYESELIQLTNLEFVDPSKWLGDGSFFTVEVTNGVFTNTMFIDDDTELASMPIPQEPFHAIGLGGQHDTDGICDQGYQLVPRYAADIIELNNVVDPSLAQKIKFYPNPVTSTLTIDSDLDIAAIRVSNLIGQEVIHKVNPDYALDVQSLSPGIYLITFQVGEAIWTDKFVRE